MATPESKVKTKVNRILDMYPNGYRMTPTTGGYGKSGVPDIVACIEGKFIGIECKANGGKPTALQFKNLNAIVAAGGHAFVVDEQSTGVFRMMLDLVVWGNQEPKLNDFTKFTDNKDETENK